MARIFDRRTRPRRGRRTLATIGLVAVSATAFGGASMAALSHGQGGAATPSYVADSAAPSPQPPVSEPTALSIPSIGVSQQLVRLQVQGGNTMQLPPYGGVGWFTGSAQPGAPGAAVVAGYIGSPDKPGAFVNLAKLGRGDRIAVARQDGSTAEFTVTDIRAYAPGKLPLDQIYAASSPTLRIVTTGGSLRPGEPNRNVVVTSVLSGIR